MLKDKNKHFQHCARSGPICLVDVKNKLSHNNYFKNTLKRFLKFKKRWKNVTHL